MTGLGNFCLVYWTLCIHGIKKWKIDKNTSICVSTETQYEVFLLSSVLMYVKSLGILAAFTLFGFGTAISISELLESL